MTKKEAIITTRNFAERDLRVSDGALRLILRVCSALYVDPKARLEEAFPLPWSKVGLWCGINDRDSAYRRLKELVTANYLKPDGPRGCPPINYFFLVPKCRENPAIDCRENPAPQIPVAGTDDTGFPAPGIAG